MAVSYFSKLKEGVGDGEGGGRSQKEGADKLPAGSSSSLTSLDPHGAGPQFAQFEKHCSRVGSIVKPAPKFIRDLALQQSCMQFFHLFTYCTDSSISGCILTA